MIVSHKHRFIFVKTMKTAGSSLEIALSKFCGEQDIITPNWDEDEAIRAGRNFRGPQNYERPLKDWSWRDYARWAVYRQRPAAAFYNHMSAIQIRQAVGQAVWDSYHKFTVVRNPWDRAVSWYYWKPAFDGRTRPSFHDFLLSNPGDIQANWPLYTEHDAVIVDQVICFEDFTAGLKELGDKVGLGGDLAEVFGSIRAKSNTRPKDARPARVMSVEDSHLIGLLAEQEIRAFGYTPPQA